MILLKRIIFNGSKSFLPGFSSCLHAGLGRRFHFGKLFLDIQSSEKRFALFKDFWRNRFVLDYLRSNFGSSMPPKGRKAAHPRKITRKETEEQKTSSSEESTHDDVDKSSKREASNEIEPPSKKSKTEELSASDKEDSPKPDDGKRKRGKAEPKKEADKNAVNNEKPLLKTLDFSCDKTTADGQKWNFKISSWNIAGLRAWYKKNGIDYIKKEDADIYCFQETKCPEFKIPIDLKALGYYTYWANGEKAGYAGVGLMSKEKPIKVSYGLGIEEHDSEGRMITAEYEKFYLVTTYVPNSGNGLKTLSKRLKWNVDFQNYIKDLDTKKPVIIAGDMNVAHTEIDLANPGTNSKTAGFTAEEREGMTEFLKQGFVDTFRKLYPDEKGAYTFWTYISNARARNTGWRLDYFIVSERFSSSVCENVIRNKVYGSDHCPITLFLHV